MKFAATAINLWRHIYFILTDFVTVSLVMFWLPCQFRLLHVQDILLLSRFVTKFSSISIHLVLYYRILAQITAAGKHFSRQISHNSLILRIFVVFSLPQPRVSSQSEFCARVCPCFAHACAPVLRMRVPLVCVCIILY